MARHAGERLSSRTMALTKFLAPYSGRLDFAARLALICMLATLVAEIYQTPEPALTAYVAFFVTKPDRTSSIVASVVMVLLITVVIGLALVLTTAVIDEPLWRVTAMALASFWLTFAASASKLRPVAGTVGLITAYVLDLLGTVPGGEVATRGLLYVWLFVAIPAGISVAVNLVLGPAPRRLVEQALANRLRLAGKMLRSPDDPSTWKAFKDCLQEGQGEIPAWLRLAATERTSPAREIAALGQAAQSTIVTLSIVDLIANDGQIALPELLREEVACVFDKMTGILQSGRYPVSVVMENSENEADLSPAAAAALAELRETLSAFSESVQEELVAKTAEKVKKSFFLPDAFSNPAHVRYALKTTGAAMFCYVVYLLLNWPSIHTCLITCYIVSLGTAAETLEKQTLRFIGCMLGASAGILAIVFLMPNVTTIGGLMAVVFLASLGAGWIAAGGPRISYAGFQLAFAFFLCVIQGPAPAFDMTIARDRTIGILFGDLVVAIVFTLIWPVSIKDRIDPAVAAISRGLAALASIGRSPTRWRIATDIRTKIGAVEQDLELTRYEPSAVRFDRAWLERRWEVVETLSAMQEMLLVSAGQGPEKLTGVAPRLDRLAESFAAGSRLQTISTEIGAPCTTEGAASAGSPSMIQAFAEAHLARLERVAAQFPGSDNQREGEHATA